MPNITKLGMMGVLGFTVFISFIEMIVSAVLVSTYNRGGYPSTQIKNVTRFTLFLSLFNMALGAAYLFFVIRLATSVIASIASFLGFFFLLWIFWLASAASSEDALGGAFSCANPDFPNCNTLRAQEAFAWINFIVIFVSFFGIAFLAFRATKKGSGVTAPLVSA